MATSRTSEEPVLTWLLDGDLAVEFQTRRDLCDDERPDLQRRIANDGEAARLLAARGTTGHWGRGFYQPKWTSSHYTLLELRDLQIARDIPACVETVALIAKEKGPDGGVNPSRTIREADACLNGMFLAYASYFGADADDLRSVIDFVLAQQLPDGGFNCDTNRYGSRVDSVHTTTSVIDGLDEYRRRGYGYRIDQIDDVVRAAVESLLVRRVYQRRNAREPIRAEFTRLHHPARWHFDVLRGLDVLRAGGVEYDDRLDDALAVVASRRRTDGRWTASSQYPGATHVAYLPTGTPNRWVTLRALRVLRHFRTPETLKVGGGRGSSASPRT